jgi:hypothetical protein
VDHSERSWRPRRRPRVALYSHDALGLGHILLNLAIAGARTLVEEEFDVRRQAARLRQLSDSATRDMRAA